MMKEETFKNKILWYNFILCTINEQVRDFA